MGHLPDRGRAEKAERSPLSAYVEIEATYLVPGDRPVGRRVDRPGFRIAVADRAPTTSTSAEPEAGAAPPRASPGLSTSSCEKLEPGRPSPGLAGERGICSAHAFWMGAVPVLQAIGTAHNAALKAFIEGFTTEAIASGLVAADHEARRRSRAAGRHAA